MTIKVIIIIIKVITQGHMPSYHSLSFTDVQKITLILTEFKILPACANERLKCLQI